MAQQFVCDRCGVELENPIPRVELELRDYAQWRHGYAPGAVLRVRIHAEVGEPDGAWATTDLCRQCCVQLIVETAPLALIAPASDRAYVAALDPRDAAEPHSVLDHPDYGRVEG
jgi:hypothetical protein